MGRGKRKSKLHSKSSTDNRSSNLSARNGRDVVPDGLDTADFENSENFSSDPLLSNHINDIKNINERVLVWNDDDIVDEKGNQVLHQLVSSQVIKTSMENSPFSKYLKSHLTDISKTNPAALSGAIMKNYRKTPPTKLQELGKYDDSEQIKKPLESLNMIELDVLSDNIESSEEISPKKTDVISTPLRRSGRSVKVNYLEMLRDSIFDTRKVSDTDSVSPTRRSKTSKTALKSPPANLEDGDGQTFRDITGILGDESAEFTPVKMMGDGVLASSNETVKPTDTGQTEKEITVEPLETVDMAEPLATAVSSSEAANDGDQSDKGRRGIKRKASGRLYDRNPHVEKITKCTVCARKVFCTRLFKNLCARCNKNTTSLLDHMQSQDNFVCLTEPACWAVSPPLDPQSRCSACAIQTLIEHRLIWGTALPQFSTLTVADLRHPDTVTRVRQDTVAMAQQTLELLERLGMVSGTGEADNKSRSIVLPDSAEDGTPCRWDIATFSSRPVTTEGALCALCKDQDTGPLLSVLPTCSVGVCHSCLSSASRAYRMALATIPVTDSGTELSQIRLERPCEPPCCGMAMRQCARCLLDGLNSVLPDLAAVRYRYRPTVNHSLICQLCVRKQHTTALLLPLASSDPPQPRQNHHQQQICMACVCRIKLAALGEGPPEEHRHTICDTHGIDCGQCLVRVVPHVIGPLRNVLGIVLQQRYQSVTSVAAKISYGGGMRIGPNRLATAATTQKIPHTAAPDETTTEVEPSVTKKQITTPTWIDWLQKHLTSHRAPSNMSRSVSRSGGNGSASSVRPRGNDGDGTNVEAARAEQDELGWRRRRTVKPTHYTDFVVGNRWYVPGSGPRKSSATARTDRNGSTHTSKSRRRRLSSQQSSQRSRAPRQSSAGPLTDSAASQDEPDTIEHMTIDNTVTPPISSPDVPPNKAAFRRIKQAQADRPQPPLPSSPASLDSEEEHPRDTPLSQDGLSRASTSPVTSSGAATRLGTGSGPRVKQVSRQSVVSTDLNLDLAMLPSSLVPGQCAVGGRQYSCVVKRANRTRKLSDGPVSKDRIKHSQQEDCDDNLDDDSNSSNNDEDDGDDSAIEADDDPEYKPNGKATASLATLLDPRKSDEIELQSRCGKCASCQRFRCCGKCLPCLRNKSQRRKTEICLKMKCLAVPQSLAYTSRTITNSKSGTGAPSRSSDGPVSKGLAVATSAPISNIQQQIRDVTATETEKSADEIIPPVVSMTTGSALTPAVPETFRDSDSSDALTSEDEQLDPELDRIHIVRGDGTTDMATVAVGGGGNAMGGFAVVSSVRARANKVLCFSCGSGGDHMIHCVSCAEPFHFFCIEFQFRPKSRKLFVCRNCTRCHACRGYGSELKCIKCQLGFHPGCVDRYPPARSDDKSDWACYKCAMCLHCGAKAEEAMAQHQHHRHDNNNRHATVATANGPIDWSKDPWQCGRCARARHSGHVCPECGRAYQTGLETVECSTCARMVHRQCAGLTEDEYEVLKGDQLPGEVEGSFKCSRCVATDHTESTGTAAVSESDDESTTRRVYQVKRRQCRDESNLKRYCERGVMHRMAEFIGRAEAREEGLLDQHQTVAVQAEHDVDRLGQLDGVDEVEDERDCEVDNSPLADRTACSTLCNSSESLGDYDVDHLISGLDLPPEPGPPPVVKTTTDIEVNTSESVVTPEVPKTGIFSRMSVTDYISPKHLLMDAVARIVVKRSRYSRQSQLGALYDELLDFLHEASLSLFPWLDFTAALEQARDTARRHAGRLKLVSAAIADGVRDCRGREFEVFASSIAEIEEKLQTSFRKGREDYIVFHSEQHLASLTRHMETCDPDQPEMFTKYRLAFTDTDTNSNGMGTNIICERDVRQCALCGYAGDDGLEGRLIYGGLDVWVHVNCALWSDEVFEREDGALVGVEDAIRRGETSICAACNNFGATVRCSARSVTRNSGKGGSAGVACSNVYHFGCAFRLPDEPVFTDSRTFFCSSDEHDSRQWHNEQQLGLADMLILRRIYLPQGCLSAVSAACPNGLVSNDVVVSIGNLRIDCLGRIEPCSDSHRVLLCPVAFQARRLYWSMDEVDALVMYFMTTRAEPDKHPSRARPDSTAFAGTTSTTGSVALSGMPSVSAPFARRRRMIETIDSRCMKRAKPMQCRQDIVYEMDDDGNLKPITNSIDMPISSSHKPLAIQDYDESILPSRRMPPLIFNDNKKENRRFPMKSRATVERPPRKQVENVTFTSNSDTRHLVNKDVEILASMSISQTVSESVIRRDDPMYSTSINLNETHNQSPWQQSRCQLVPVLQAKSQQPQQQSHWLPLSQCPQQNQLHHIPVRRQLSTRSPRYLYISTSRPSAHTVSLSTTSLSSVSLFNGNGRRSAATTADQVGNLSTGVLPANTSAIGATLSAVSRETPVKLLTGYNKPIGSPVCTDTNIVGSSGLPRVVSVTGNHHIGSSNKSDTTHSFMPNGSTARCRGFSHKSRPPGVIKVVKLPSSASSSASSRKLINSGNNRAETCLRVPRDPHPLNSGRPPTAPTLCIGNVYGSGVSSTPSVLRTVLTDGVLQQQHRQSLSKRQRPAVDSNSSYVISSCGSLSSLNRVPPLLPAQYDGAADDWTQNTFDGPISLATAGAKSNGSVSCAAESGTGSHLDGFCLRFAIEGFKASKSPKSTWTYLVRRVAQLRESQGMAEYSLRTADGWAKFGLEHRHVVYLVEQLVGAFLCRNYEFKFHKARVQQLRQQHLPQVVPEHGCSRFDPWTRVRLEHVVRDPLAFLHCKANGPPKNHAPSSESADRKSGNGEDDPAPDDDYLENLATQFRSLHSGVHARENNVRVCCSVIHGRGLFARRGFEAHDIIIEYVGEVIRSILSDVRETEYQRTGVDCYMFRLDQDHIVDATVKGNAARFINHSCHPNCYAKVVRFEGSKHIIIIAQRTIHKGEELTYDYRFPIEDDKLPCTCGSFSCRKYLN